MLKVLIATGGTGGHLFPAQQTAKELSDCTILFAGHKLQMSPFFDRSVPYEEIASSNRNPFSILKGIWQSLRLVFRFKPDVVLGFGSFHSFPTLIAAVLLRKKIVLFEANCSFGKVIRFFAPFASKIALQFPVEKIPKQAAFVPLLPWGVKQEKIERKAAREFYHLEPNTFTILVFGGSQGAKFINETFCKAAKLLDFPFQVIHLTGKEDPAITYSQRSVIKPFEKQMGLAYAAADMAVCRCGAGTTAELIRFQIPSVLIPYPYAYDHQRKNGEFLKQGARVLLQKDTTAETLAASIRAVKEHLEFHTDALRKIALPKNTDLSAIIRAIGKNK